MTEQQISDIKREAIQEHEMIHARIALREAVWKLADDLGRFNRLCTQSRVPDARKRLESLIFELDAPMSRVLEELADTMLEGPASIAMAQLEEGFRNAAFAYNTDWSHQKTITGAEDK